MNCVRQIARHVAELVAFKNPEDAAGFEEGRIVHHLNKSPSGLEPECQCRAHANLYIANCSPEDGFDNVTADKVVEVKLLPVKANTNRGRWGGAVCERLKQLAEMQVLKGSARTLVHVAQDVSSYVAEHLPEDRDIYEVKRIERHLHVRRSNSCKCHAYVTELLDAAPPSSSKPSRRITRTKALPEVRSSRPKGRMADETDAEFLDLDEDSSYEETLPEPVAVVVESSQRTLRSKSVATASTASWSCADLQLSLVRASSHRFNGQRQAFVQAAAKAGGLDIERVNRHLADESARCSCKKVAEFAPTGLQAEDQTEEAIIAQFLHTVRASRSSV